MKRESMRRHVREKYARVVRGSQSCCGPASPCCDPSGARKGIAGRIGYSEEELASVPEASNLGLGCGNPVALASLQPGETVLDLGSGAGIDCFLAARKVGAKGRVIGVDMTPEMLAKARENAERDGCTNVEFRLGEIEHLPVADSSVDVIISNCVINLAIDKPQVFREAFRVLKPNGRLLVSDIVLLKPLPEFLQESVAAYVGCIAGAMQRDEYLGTIRDAGFQDVRVLMETPFSLECILRDPVAQAVADTLELPPGTLAEVGRSVVSIHVFARKAG